MSKLREAAKAALTAYEEFRDVDDIDGLDDAMDRLRAALAQPETEAQPVAWQSRYIGRGEPFGEWRTIGWSLEECANLTRGAVEHMRAQTDFEVRPLYAHPPRDEWRPASEPPEDGRDVVVWCAQERRAVHGMYVRRHPPVVGLVDGWVAPDAAKLTHWRDVTPPTESTIAAKCQRIERSGEICGLTPPCPDCGSSLIDVAEGSL